MLCMHVAQICLACRTKALKAIRRFVGIDLALESAPDATILLKFHRLLEEKELTDSIFNAINAYLAAKGLFLRQGTVVDATIIAAPPSTKNRDGQRDPAMHQAKKGNQWHFGMMAHISVDAESGLTHTVVIGTAADVSDVTQTGARLHGDETDVFR
jgi:IS5 family transposase